MSFLKTMLEENASAGATSAAGVAGHRGSLFDRKKKRKKGKAKDKAKETTMLQRMIGEEEEKFDPSDVLSKMKSASRKDIDQRDTVGFALEDEDGNIVKVYVPAEDAENFENELAMMLHGEDENGDRKNSSMEIAEVLFKLKGKYEIVNADWSGIPEDEEEEQDVATVDEGGDDIDAGGDEGGEGDEKEMTADEQGGEGDMLGGEGGEGDLGAGGGEDTPDDTKSALDAVISVMKADAEAKKAEAEAKKKEHEAEIAKHNANAAEAKVKQEEEVLDMETYNGAKAAEKKESEKLSKLAKYRHDLKNDDAGVNAEDEFLDLDAGTEEEEREFSSKEIASFVNRILNDK